MNESDEGTETSSRYCATELTTAKKYEEPLITTEATKETQRAPDREEPAVIKQAREELLRELDAAGDLFARLQLQMREEATEYEELLARDAQEIAKAQEQVEVERTRLDEQMLLSAELEEEKRGLDQLDAKSKMELNQLVEARTKKEGEIHQIETDLAVQQYEMRLLNSQGEEMKSTITDLLREEAKIAKEKAKMDADPKKRDIEVLNIQINHYEEKANEFEQQKTELEAKIADELLPAIHKTEMLTTEIKLEIHEYKMELKVLTEQTEDYANYLPLLEKENKAIEQSIQSHQFKLQLVDDAQNKV